MRNLLNNGVFLGLYEKALPASIDWEQRLELAGKAGFDFMEISIDESEEKIERLKWDKVKKKKLWEASAQAGIPLISMCLSANRRFPIGSSHRNIQQRGVEILTDAIYFASELGIRIVQVAGYDTLIDEESTEETRKSFGKNLKKALQTASSLGVMLALENIDVEFGKSLDNLMKYVKENNSPWLNLYPDIGNLAAMNMDVISQLRSARSRIAAIHVKDTIKNVVRRIPYGGGIVDFISVFEELKRISFCGPMLLEMWADEDNDNFEKVKNARLWVLNQMEKAGYSPVYNIE